MLLIIVRKRKKKIITRRKIIIKIKGSHRRVLERHGVLNEVVLVLVLLVGARVPLRRERAVVQEVPVSRGREILAVLVVHSAVDVIVGILGIVDKATEVDV